MSEFGRREKGFFVYFISCQISVSKHANTLVRIYFDFWIFTFYPHQPHFWFIMEFSAVIFSNNTVQVKPQKWWIRDLSICWAHSRRWQWLQKVWENIFFFARVIMSDEGNLWRCKIPFSCFLFTIILTSVVVVTPSILLSSIIFDSQSPKKTITKILLCSRIFSIKFHATYNNKFSFISL